MAIPVYDNDNTDNGFFEYVAGDPIPECHQPQPAKPSNPNAGVLSPLTAKFVQFYMQTHQHEIAPEQLKRLTAWRTQYLAEQELLKKQKK